MSSSRKRPAKPRFRPAVEALEDRAVPAGDIHAFVAGGTLYVVGDNLDNQVAVAGMGKRSAAVVPLGDTTVNGGTVKVEFGDIDRGYHVRLAGGNDDIVLVNTTALQSLNVDGEAGNDNITLDGVISKRETFVGSGAGDDNVVVMNSDLRRRVAIDQGAGNDRLSISGSRFDRDLFATGGTGTNTFASADSAFRFSPIVRGYATRLSTALPIAGGDAATVARGESVTIAVLANDRPQSGTLDPSTVTITSQPLNGTATANADGTITYTSTGDPGPDTFKYTVANSGGGVSAPATVSVTVTGVGQGNAPTATVTTTAPNPTNLDGIPFTVTFSEGVTGFDQSDLTVTNGTASGFTAVSPTTYTFTVAPTADGVVSVVVPKGAAADSSGLTNPASDPLTVSSIRTDAGMANTIPDTTAADFVAVGSSGLKVRDVTLGSGTQVSANSSITVFYAGYLTDGTVFDSRRSPAAAVTFKLTNLIQGWQQGLIGMKPGGIRQLFIPAALGYGVAGSPPSIPPNADLVFEIKLLAVA